MCSRISQKNSFKKNCLVKMKKYEQIIFRHNRQKGKNRSLNAIVILRKKNYLVKIKKYEQIIFRHNRQKVKIEA